MQNMRGRKEIQMGRMWHYFVDATAQLIEEEGIENVTIRKIADLAGYTSSTIYNYFGELSHLIFFASMRFMKEYTKELSIYMSRSDDSIQKYLLTWECFCKHSFHNPHIYHAIFIADLGDQPEKLLEHYYQEYPTDLIEINDDLKPLIFEHSLSKRSRSLLFSAVNEGLIAENDIEPLNEMTVLIWQGMLTTILNNRRSDTTQDAIGRTMKYITSITLNYVRPGYTQTKGQ